MPDNEDPPVGREDLPVSLWPHRVSVGAANPVELDLLAKRTPKTVPFPEDKHPNEGVAKGYRNLAQYRGRSEEGNRKSMANLRRKVKLAHNKPPEIPESMPRPNVPAKKPPKPPGMATLKGRNLRAVMSQEEWDLFLETWIELYEGHAEDWDKPEDKIDVERICMETVVQFRMQSYERSRDKRFDPNAYHQSTIRQQQARQNLEARRADRNRQKGTKSTTTNVLVSLGNSVQPVVKEKLKAIAEQEEEDMKFLEATNKQNIAAIIDSHIRKEDDDDNVIEADFTEKEADDASDSES